MSKHILAILTVMAITLPAFAGDVFTEDFNGGEFIDATNTRTVLTSGDSSYTYYAWAPPGDNLDGWTALTDTSGGELGPNGEIRLSGSLQFFNTGAQEGANSLAGFDTSDGNVSAFYQKQNDVPKSGWLSPGTALTAGMGGARDGSGNALAFTLHYDAELVWIHDDRGAIGKVNADLLVDGAKVGENDSPHFYRTTRPSTGDAYTFQNFSAAEMAAATIVDALPVGVELNTQDGSQDAVHHVTSGVIEANVANGQSLQVRFLHNRFDEKTASSVGVGSNWQYMNMAADNVKLVVLEAGDADGDLDVDIDDAGVLIGNFNGSGSWVDGDFDGDGDVDIDDAGDLIGNFGTAYDVAAGMAEISYDAVGNQLVIDANAVAFVKVSNVDGLFVENGYTPIFAFSTVQQPGVDGLVAGEFITGNFITGQGLVDLVDGAVGEVTLEYKVLGGASQFQTILVPEPASLALLGLGGLLIVRRRRAA